MTITINWNSKSSIKKAEKLKKECENKGLKLVGSITGINKSLLVYKKR